MEFLRGKEAVYFMIEMGIGQEAHKQASASGNRLNVCKERDRGQGAWDRGQCKWVYCGLWTVGVGGLSSMDNGLSTI